MRLRINKAYGAIRFLLNEILWGILFPFLCFAIGIVLALRFDIPVEARAVSALPLAIGLAMAVKSILTDLVPFLRILKAIQTPLIPTRLTVIGTEIRFGSSYPILSGDPSDPTKTVRCLSPLPGSILKAVESKAIPAFVSPAGAVLTEEDVLKLAKAISNQGPTKAK